MIFRIQNFKEGDLHSTGGIKTSFQGVYNSTGGIQISFLGVYKSTDLMRIQSKKAWKFSLRVSMGQGRDEWGSAVKNE